MKNQLTQLQKDEMAVFDKLIESEKLHERLVALFMINVVKKNGFIELDDLAKHHASLLPGIAQKVKNAGMDSEAESIRVVAALFEVMSVNGVLAGRITTEQNRSAQHERHEKTKKELIPLMDQFIHSIEHPISSSLGTDLFIESNPSINKSYTMLQKLFTERRLHLGYPLLPRGRPSCG